MNFDITKVTEDLDIHNVSPISDDHITKTDDQKIYNELNNILATGDKILRASEYLVTSTPDPDNIASAASLISSLKDVMKEFTVLYRDEIKFKRQMQLENFKAQKKKELVLLKMSEKENNDLNDEEMIEFSQESIVRSLLNELE